MGLNPNEYDVEELRSVTEGEFPEAGFERRVKEYGFLWTEPSKFRAVGVEDPTPEQRERLMELEGADPTALSSKPYLESVPDDDEAILTWLEFLVATGGNEGALEALERYCTLGWITDSVESDLRGYMLGVGREEGNGLAAFDPADHLLSFAYVARLAALTE